MRRALTLLLLVALVPALAAGTSLRSDGYYKEKFLQVRLCVWVVCGACGAWGHRFPFQWSVVHRRAS